MLHSAPLRGRSLWAGVQALLILPGFRAGGAARASCVVRRTRGLQSGPSDRARVCVPPLACPRLGTRTCLHERGGWGACSAQRFAVHAAISLARWLRFTGLGWLVPYHWQGGGRRLTSTLQGVEVLPASPSRASSGEKVSRALPPLGRTIQLFLYESPSACFAAASAARAFARWRWALVCVGVAWFGTP